VAASRVAALGARRNWSQCVDCNNLSAGTKLHGARSPFRIVGDRHAPLRPCYHGNIGGCTHGGAARAGPVEASRIAYFLRRGRVPFRPWSFAAAHKTLRFGRRVRVIDLKTGRSVIVTITDRGPFNGGRVLDLCTRAGRVLGMIDRGLIPVRAEILPREDVMAGP
jgi:hypothetical protein